MDRTDDEIRYSRPDDIDFRALPRSLGQLHFFWDNMFLRVQANNLAIVDEFITKLEYQNLRAYLEEEKTPSSTYFLLAQSQMWIFAAYELLRTWDERVRDILKWERNGGIPLKLKDLKALDKDPHRHGNEVLKQQLEAVLSGDVPAEELDAHHRHVQIQFKQLEWIRVALAKHEVKGKQKIPALSPGYGRLNLWCGSLDFELENGKYIMGFVNRRDIADGLRHLDLTGEPPSEETLKEYDDYMSGKDFNPKDMIPPVPPG